MYIYICIYIYAYRYGCENLCYLGDLRASSLSFTAVLIMCCKRLLMKLLFPPVSSVRFKFSASAQHHDHPSILELKTSYNIYKPTACVSKIG